MNLRYHECVLDHTLFLQATESLCMKSFSTLFLGGLCLIPSCFPPRVMRPTATLTIALTKVETSDLDLPFPDRSGTQRHPVTLACYLTRIARLGGYLARPKAPPPGNAIMCRGMSRLKDVEIGFVIGARVVGH